MSENDQHIYRIDTFSPDQKFVAGPRELREDDALGYLAQRMADQHRGSLGPTYWRDQARLLLERARDQVGAPCLYSVARGRSVTVTAELSSPAAVYEVRVFPLYEDDGDAGELCAAFDHPRLAVAMREAGVRAESWIRVEAAEWHREEERGGDLVGFEVEIYAYLKSPLLAGSPQPGTGDVERGEPYAPQRGCSGELEPESVSTDA